MSPVKYEDEAEQLNLFTCQACGASVELYQGDEELCVKCGSTNLKYLTSTKA